jgi:AcrR family transcriptional regulator
MAEDTRERILDAALAVFADAGFAGATTRTIAAAAGCNVATLAYHYGDKQGLYDAVVDRIYEAMVRVEVPTDWPATPRERLRKLVRFAWTYIRGHRDDIRVLLRHVMDAGVLPERARDRWTGELQARAMQMMLLLEVRLPEKPLLALLTLNHLIVRYGITDTDELRRLTGEHEAEDVVAEHVADVACMLFGL